MFGRKHRHTDPLTNHLWKPLQPSGTSWFTVQTNCVAEIKKKKSQRQGTGTGTAAQVKLKLVNKLVTSRFITQLWVTWVYSKKKTKSTTAGRTEHDYKNWYWCLNQIVTWWGNDNCDKEHFGVVCQEKNSKPFRKKTLIISIRDGWLPAQSITRSNIQPFLPFCVFFNYPTEAFE